MMLNVITEDKSFISHDNHELILQIFEGKTTTNNPEHTHTHTHTHTQREKCGLLMNTLPVKVWKY